MAGVVGDDLIQLGPVGVSTAQVAFDVLLAEPLDDGPPSDPPHIDIHEGDVTGGTSSKGCVLATLLPTPERVSSVGNIPRSGWGNVLVGDDSGDFFTAGLYDTLDTLLDSGEHHISRENELIPFPERRSGRE